MSWSKRWFQSEEGSALVMILVFVTMMSILGISLVYIGITHHKNVLKDELKLQAYYAAEAGIMDAVKQLENNRSVTFVTDPTFVSTTTSGVQLQYTLQTKGRNGTAVTVTSVGNAYKSNKLQSSATITVTLDKTKPKEFQTIPFFDYSLYSNQPLVLGQEKISFHDWGASLPLFGFTYYSNDNAILKNQIDVEGNIYSGTKVQLYDTDQLWHGKFSFLAEIFGIDPTLLLKPGENQQLLGIRPNLDNGKIVTPGNVYKTGYNLLENGLFSGKGYHPDTKSKDERNASENQLSDAQLKTLYGSSLSLEKQMVSNLSTIFSQLESEIQNKKSIYNMKEYPSDLHITNTAESKAKLQGWFHVMGNLIIDEGVTIEDLKDVVALVDGNVLIGAIDSSSSHSTFQPVKLHGSNILLIAKGVPKSNWKTIIENQSAIRDNVQNGMWLSWIGWKTYNAQSFMNQYANQNTDQLSVLMNEGTEIDGWIIGRNDVVMDYPISNTAEAVGNANTIKINGGIIGNKILFPRSIQIAKDLFIYDWKVEYK